MERYSRSYVLCPRCVLLIYPSRPHPLYLNLSLYPPLDYSYSLQIRFVLLLPLCCPVRQHHKTCRDLLLRQLVAYAACRNCADLNPLSPQRRGSLVACQCRRRRNAAQQIRRTGVAKTLRGMRLISINNDSSRHEQQQRLPILRQFSKTNNSTLLLTTES
ncbi:hypothetical protein HBI09_126780 [Parastagonospora nodorum]|nr:hypothetical protein HBI09_126780 [Parastagonospora nodorum]KAH5003088.1 hypothetical protein HBI77_130930 [Parastagonospora nodorum]